MKRRDFLHHMALTAVAATAAWQGPLSQARATVLPPDPFFGRNFPDVNGRQFELADYLGKPLVLNFWATWCPPCVKEMPDIEHLHRSYPQVSFIGLGVDTAANIVKFGQKVQVSYPLLVGGHGAIELMRGLGNKNGGLPFTVVFDKHGQIARRVLGQIDADDLQRVVQGLVH